jgi:hypothetical protein
MANENMAAYRAAKVEKAARDIVARGARFEYDVILAHLTVVDDVSAEFGFELDPSKITVGATREQIVTIAEAKAKNYRKHAGLRALKAKLGKEGAEQYISRKAGRHISIR